MEKYIIGFSGAMDAGKGLGTELIKSWFPDTPSFRFSDSLREFVAWMNKEWGVKYQFTIPGATSDLQEISTALRQIFGEDLLERAIAHRVASAKGDSPFVIIEGIRRTVDIGNFLALPNFRLIYVEADFDVRYARHILRNEKPGDAELSREEFAKLGEAEAEQQIRLLKPHAHIVIENNGTPEEFARTLRSEVDQCLRV